MSSLTAKKVHWCRWLIAIAMTLPLLAVPATHADAVKIGEFWLKPVTVEGVMDGQLAYTTKFNVEIRKPLAEINALRLAKYPQLEEAAELAATGEYLQVLKKLGTIRRPQSWLRDWISAQVVQIAGDGGDATRAVNAFLELLQNDADAYYLSRPPVDAVLGADEATRKSLLEKITKVADGLKKDHPAAPALSKLLKAAGSSSPRPVMKKPTITGNLKVVVSSQLPAKEQAGQLLQAGQARKALELVNKQLNAPDAENLATKLYVRGLAELELAERARPTEAKTLYRDAGLSFMRVVIHFPRSRFEGASKLEAGYVHSKIGRPDTAARLYEQAAASIRKDQPELRERLTELQATLNPGSTDARDSVSPRKQKISRHTNQQKESRR